MSEEKAEVEFVFDENDFKKGQKWFSGTLYDEDGERVFICPHRHEKLADAYNCAVEAREERRND